jgi:hypothetical protein
MLDDVAPSLLDLGVRGLSMDLDDEQADVPAPVPPPPSDEAVRAVVSLWLDCYDERAPHEAVLRHAGTALDGYLVVESVPTEYGDNRWSRRRDWPDGQRSPGLLTVATICQPDGMDTEAWLDHWHRTVSPVTAEIQPRARYVRNAVFRALTPGSPPFRALVEEAWPSAEDITDPMRFYCARDEQELEEHLRRMLEVITAFTDLSTMRSYTMSEWILRS